MIVTVYMGKLPLLCYKDGAIKIRHDNSQKFETLTDGIKVTGAMALSETTDSNGNR